MDVLFVASLTECLRVVVDIARPVNYLSRRSSRALPVAGFPIGLTS